MSVDTMPVWLDTESGGPEDASGEDWTPPRPADLPPLEADPIFEAQAFCILAHRMLTECRDRAQRATTVLARAQLAAMAAKEDLDAAIALCTDALWMLCEAPS